MILNDIDEVKFGKEEEQEELREDCEQIDLENEVIWKKEN